ncbi:hypothetical protein U1Q18_037056 [Sarracenia purpurea var. burkii]
MRSGQDLVASSTSGPNLGAVCASRDVELGLADLHRNGTFGCSDLEDLTGVVDDGVVSVLYRLPNAG